ncbi:hypothetical protein TGGT1_225953 [Toxoplasma gondii GT1]|uniref:Uncharacterized protein n=1 Tax=Toxoplasma gondii (strain ATCC 50853 / GT1) TaxID=507601 RepID=S7WCM5_TOXGG|nr:hypothetical protein TGGT1_225953 [Toxoplasma gondii GT1]
MRVGLCLGRGLMALSQITVYRGNVTIPFILINNVAASVSQEAAQIPSSEQAEMTRLCVNTMGPGFVYSPARHLCEPAAAAAASVEEV